MYCISVPEYLKYMLLQWTQTHLTLKTCFMLNNYIRDTVYCFKPLFLSARPYLGILYIGLDNLYHMPKLGNFSVYAETYHRWETLMPTHQPYGVGSVQIGLNFHLRYKTTYMSHRTTPVQVTECIFLIFHKAVFSIFGVFPKSEILYTSAIFQLVVK